MRNHIHVTIVAVLTLTESGLTLKTPIYSDSAAALSIVPYISVGEKALPYVKNALTPVVPTFM